METQWKHVPRAWCVLGVPCFAPSSTSTLWGLVQDHSGLVPAQELHVLAAKAMSCALGPQLLQGLLHLLCQPEIPRGREAEMTPAASDCTQRQNCPSLGHPGVWQLWVCWGGSLAPGWDGEPACLIPDPELGDTVWLLCTAGLTLKLLPSLVPPPLGPLLGCFWLPQWLCGVSVPEGSLQCPGTRGQAVLGQTSVPWGGPALCPGIPVPGTELMDSTVLRGPGTGDAQDYSGELPPSSGQDSPCLGLSHLP